MDTATRSKPQQFQGVQYLRGIAALMVIFHHARNQFGGAMSIEFGARGVELFFVISGLVMMSSTRGGIVAGMASFSHRCRAIALFWSKRFLRIAPLYWIALVLTALLATQPNAVDGLVLLDALFIAHWSTVFPHEIWPLLVPGWSLNYEIFFYLLFGLSLVLERAAWLALTVVVIGLCSLSWFLGVGRSSSVAAQFCTDPVMLNFIAGVLLFKGLQHYHHRLATVPRWLVVAILLLACAGLVAKPSWGGSLWLPICATGIVGSSIILFQDTAVASLKLLGDASYSIYLFHLGSFFLTKKILAAIGLGHTTHAEIAATFAFYITIAVAAGLLVHVFLEQPLNRMASRALGSRPRVPAAVALT